MTGVRYWNIEGEPLTLFEWAALFESLEYRMVASTVVKSAEISRTLEGPEVIHGGIWVSTVWIGFDVGGPSCLDPLGSPSIFESMVFGGPLDHEIRRYCTAYNARVGHADLVTEVHRALKAIDEISSPGGVSRENGK